jgi:hypothetical protein
MDWLGHSNAPTSGASSQALRHVVLFSLSWIVTLSACDTRPDPNEVAGALAFAARAIEDRDSRELYQVIDERARHAMHSIVHDRNAAADIIRETYPESEQRRALTELGDAVGVEDAVGLFEARCEASCREELGASIGGVERTEEDGDELVVHTTRGAELRLYRRGEGHWWGIVWHTEALDRERSRANQDLRRVEANAETYRRRSRLEGREDSPAPADSTMDSGDSSE